MVLVFGGLAHAAPPVSEDGDVSEVGDTSEVGEEDAPEPSTAGEWYARGYELGKAREYEAAADAFMRSYGLKPTSEALFNAALALENSGDTLAAIETYERVLVEPSIAPALADQANASIEALTRTVATLKDIRYVATRPPVELFIRGEPVALDAFPLRVLPGEIEIEVVDEQGVHAKESYDLLAGEALVVDLRGLLPALPKPLPQPPPEPNPGHNDTDQTDLDHGRLAARAAKLRRTTWVSLGLTGATAIAMVPTGIVMQRERARFATDSCYDFPNDACPDDFPIGEPDLHYARQRAYTIATGIVGGISASFALTALITGVLSVRASRKAKAARAAQVRVRPALGGLTLQF